MTFDAAADVWLEAHVARLRPASRETYATHVKHLRKRFGRTRLAAITPAEVARYVADMDRRGAAGWTQRGRLTALSGVFTYASRHLGHAGVNPVSLLDRYERPDADDEREHRVLTDDEIDRTLAAAGGYRLLLQAAAQTGARKAEVLGLTWGDVDTQARTVSIDRQLDAEAGASS
jgi:integrase